MLLSYKMNIEHLISYPLQNGYVEFCPNYLSLTSSETLYKSLLKLNFTQSEVHNYGKTYLTPRLQAWMGDSSINASLYTQEEPNPWTKEVLDIKQKLEEITKFQFDYVLINYYRDGNDYIAYHADKEAIGEGKNVIASISIGASRKFVLKHNDKNIPKRSFILNNGSLIIMKGDDTQQYWKHTITKTKVVKDPRINLTFRHS